MAASDVEPGAKVARGKTDVFAENAVIWGDERQKGTCFLPNYSSRHEGLSQPRHHYCDFVSNMRTCGLHPLPYHALDNLTLHGVSDKQKAEGEFRAEAWLWM